MTRPDDTSDGWPLDDECPPEDQWPPHDWGPTDYSVVGAEPIVGVPAGVLGTAIELLDLCDEMFNRPGSKALDVHVSAVLCRYERRTSVTTPRWFHDGLGITAWRLRELLDDDGIAVEPTLRGRPGPHYR